MELTETLEKLAQYFGLTAEQLTAKCRKREIVYPRQMVCAYLAIHQHEVVLINGKKAFFTLQRIAKQMKYFKSDGEGDHATVLHCIKQVQNQCDVDVSYLKYWQKFCEYADSVWQLNEVVV